MALEVDFVPFATGSGANVTEQATYIGESTTSTGYVSGVASSADCNKAWRQGTVMAAVLANWIANVLNTNVLDNGELSAQITLMTSAVTTAATAAATTVVNTALGALTLPFTKITGEIANAQVPQGAVTQFESELAIAHTQVSGLAASATTDTTNASNISSGTLAAARLPSSVALLTGAAFTGAVSATSGSFGSLGVTGDSTFDGEVSCENELVVAGEGLFENELAVYSPTAATSDANQNSPLFIIQGNYWNGSASESDGWHFVNSLGSGSNPTSTLEIVHVGSSGAITISIQNLTASGNITAASFAGAGTLLTALNGSNVTSGTVPLARLPTIPTSQISGLAASATTDTTNASNISSGTLANARLPTAITISGTMTAGGFNQSSDLRLKEDLHPIDNALAKIGALRGVSFRFRGASRRSLGLIAQEVQEVLPELVSRDDTTEYLSVAYGNLVGVLVEAIKELSQRVAVLEGGGGN